MLKGQKPSIVKLPEVPKPPVAPSILRWGPPKTGIPVGAEKKPLSLEKLLLSVKDVLSDDQVSCHPSPPRLGIIDLVSFNDYPR